MFLVIEKEDSYFSTARYVVPMFRVNYIDEVNVVSNAMPLVPQAAEA